MSEPTVTAFSGLVRQVTDAIAGKPLDGALEAFLNEAFPSSSPAFQAISEACTRGIAEGWICAREAGGIKFGRVVKPSPELSGFSVDVVVMDDCQGPHHSHPKGEVDMVMPIDKDAAFDGQGAGWKVYGPGSAHYPTVRGGAAVVLYLLPDGAIAFSKV
ncbi:DUF4863 family protein [Rhodospirillum sp. A1_3_36]|uniref:4-hydroxylaminobenzoate lyase n=1 Tax=Rhodospirillum sp. A1_3_36 TaxID=3391666 RepID=UPI0039A729F9